jgi:hypothetical protein
LGIRIQPVNDRYIDQTVLIPKWKTVLAERREPTQKKKWKKSLKSFTTNLLVLANNNKHSIQKKNTHKTGERGQRKNCRKMAKLTKNAKHKFIHYFYLIVLVFINLNCCVSRTDAATTSRGECKLKWKNNYCSCIIAFCAIIFQGMKKAI